MSSLSQKTTAALRAHTGKAAFVLASTSPGSKRRIPLWAHTLTGALCLSLALPCAAMPLAGAQTAGGRGITVTPDSALPRVAAMIYQGRYSYVRLEASEPGAAPSAHPFNISHEALRQTLAQVRLAGDQPDASEVLFNVAQLDELVPPLARALALATEKQDVTFAVSGQHQGVGPFASHAVTTGRVFFNQQGLHLVFGLVRADFENALRGTGVLMAFEPGQRQQPLSPKARLSAPQAESGRNDWLWWPKAASHANPPTSIPAPPGHPASSLAPTPSDQPTAEDLVKNVTQRLKALQMLRDQGLITPSEYQTQRGAILGGI